MKYSYLIGLCLLAPHMAQGQFTSLMSGTTAELRGLSVVSPSVVWASGQRGTVVHTTDGGTSWRVDTVPGASKLDLRAIAATSDLVAHAMSIGDSSRIFRTTDGGRTWTERFIYLRKGSFLDAIRFWDPKHGIAMSDPVDGHFLIATTSDGGESWKPMDDGALPPSLLNEGGFAASGTSLAVFGDDHVWLATGGASAARVFRSSDRGQTWTVASTPLRAGIASAGVFSVAFRDELHGVVAGGDYVQPKLGGRNVALTSDGGRNWTLVDSVSSPAGYRSAVAYAPGTGGRVLMATGLSGSDLSIDGGHTWTPIDSVGFNSISFVSPAVAFVVGPRGRIAKVELK